MNDIDFLRAMGIEPYRFPDLHGISPRSESEGRGRDLFIRAYAILQLVAMVATLLWTLRN